MILSQAKSPEGIIQPWANEKLGFSENLIHAVGDQLTLLAEIIGATPTEVNNRLKEANAFVGDQIQWDKIFIAFPHLSALVHDQYNNDFVLQALTAGRFVIVLTDKRAVRYMGGGVCHDPKTGTEKLTSEFPDVRSFVVITHIPQQVEVLPEDKEKTVEPPKEVVKKKPGRPKGSVSSKKVETDPKKAIEKYLKQIRISSLALTKLLKS